MIICFDIGGTSIKGALAKDPETIKILPKIPTPLDEFDTFVAALQSVIDQSPEPPKCVSISIAGVIDPVSQKAIVANIPSVHGREFQNDLEAALRLPVLVTNDADCFTLAEAELGAGRGHAVVFGIILGTGVGGGVVVDGQLINKNGGYAGEWGHGPVAATSAGTPPVDIPRFVCGCGLVGCIDPICSARGMEKLHQHLHRQEQSAETILNAWIAGDAQADRTIDVYVDLIASPLAMVLNTIGASIVPVGGGLSNVPELIARIDKQVRQRILLKPEHSLIVPAMNKIEPGIIGAAVLGQKLYG